MAGTPEEFDNRHKKNEYGNTCHYQKLGKSNQRPQVPASGCLLHKFFLLNLRSARLSGPIGIVDASPIVVVLSATDAHESFLEE